jgi:hypothetical protein
MRLCLQAILIVLLFFLALVLSLHENGGFPTPCIHSLVAVTAAVAFSDNRIQ